VNSGAHQRGYLPVTPSTLASGRACIGRLSSSFLAPQTLQTRWFATSGTASRFGNQSDPRKHDDRISIPVEEQQFVPRRIDTPGSHITKRREKLAFLVHDRRRASHPGARDRTEGDPPARNRRPASKSVTASGPADRAVGIDLEYRLNAIDHAAAANVFN
jgi:hypothetical protein